MQHLAHTKYLIKVFLLDESINKETFIPYDMRQDDQSHSDLIVGIVFNQSGSWGFKGND